MLSWIVWTQQAELSGPCHFQLWPPLCGSVATTCLSSGHRTTQLSATMGMALDSMLFSHGQHLTQLWTHFHTAVGITVMGHDLLLLLTAGNIMLQLLLGHECLQMVSCAYAR